MKTTQEEKQSLTIITASRITLIAISLLATLFPTRTPYPGENLWTTNAPIAGLFARWDTGWYLYIAEHGYDKKLLYAFRPIYPTILNITHRILPGNHLKTMATTGFIWNIIILLITTITLHRLTNHLYDTETAEKTITLLAIYPSTIFLTAQYPEATYLLLTTLTLYQLEKQQYTYATLTAVTAGLTRPEALLLAAPFLLRYIYIDRNPKLLTGTATTLATAPAFMLFTHLNGDNPLYLVTSQEEWNNIRILNILTHHPTDQTPFLIIGALTMITAITATLIQTKEDFNLKDTKTHYQLWALMLLTVFTLVGDLKSWTRYTLTIIPIYWSLATGTKNRDWLQNILIIAYTSIMTYATIAYVNWYHFL